MYSVEVEFSPAYELITSLYTYLEPTGRKITELGGSWMKDVQNRLEPWLVEELKDQKLEVLHRLSLFVWQCPDKSIDFFLAWIENMPASEMYEYLTPWVKSIPKEISEIKDQIVKVLKGWNEQYFSQIKKSILLKLEEDALQKKDMYSQFDSIEFIEYCTNGLRIESSNVRKIILAPQYHQSPFSVTDYFDGLITCLYPADVEEEQGGINKKTLRQIKSLSEKKRIEILKFLYGGPKTFSDIQQYTGIVKSNVHYHIALLRTAGFIRAHHNSQRVERYSFREGILDGLNKSLGIYIKGK